MTSRARFLFASQKGLSAGGGVLAQSRALAGVRSMALGSVTESAGCRYKPLAKIRVQRGPQQGVAHERKRGPGKLGLHILVQQPCRPAMRTGPLVRSWSLRMLRPIPLSADPLLRPSHGSGHSLGACKQRKPADSVTHPSADLRLPMYSRGIRARKESVKETRGHSSSRS